MPGKPIELTSVSAFIDAVNGPFHPIVPLDTPQSAKTTTDDATQKPNTGTEGTTDKSDQPEPAVIDKEDPVAPPKTNPTLWSRLYAAAPSARTMCINATFALGAAGLAYYGGKYAYDAYGSSSAASSIAESVAPSEPSVLDKLTGLFHSAAPSVTEESILPEPTASRLSNLTSYFRPAASATETAEQAASELADSGVSAAGGFLRGWVKGKSGL